MRVRSCSCFQTLVDLHGLDLADAFAIGHYDVSSSSSEQHEFDELHVKRVRGVFYVAIRGELLAVVADGSNSRSSGLSRYGKKPGPKVGVGDPNHLNVGVRIGTNYKTIKCRTAEKVLHRAERFRISNLFGEVA